MLLEDVHRAGHKGGFRADRQGHGIERAIERAEGSGLRLLVEFGSRGILSLRQTIDAVVEKEDLDTDVAAEHVDGVVAADGEGVTVAGGYPDFQVWVDGLDPRGDGGRAAMNGVKTERVHVVGEAAGAANSADDDEFLARDAELREHRLHSGQNRIVAAAGAPADLLVGLKILLRKSRKRGRGHSRISQNPFSAHRRRLKFASLKRRAFLQSSLPVHFA